MAALGNATLRSKLSRWTRLGSAETVASAKKLQSMSPSRSITG
jgi:hypothetical protein